MALKNLSDWTTGKDAAAASACGTSDKPAACGSGDKPSACGSGEKPEEKPSACGSACGVGGK